VAFTLLNILASPATMTSELSLLRARSNTLPENCPSWMHFQQSAIDIVSASSASENDKNLVISAVHHAPSRQGQMAVAWAITDLVDPQTEVTKLADFIYTRMLVPCQPDPLLALSALSD
jgi:hypothetical protein